MFAPDKADLGLARIPFLPADAAGDFGDDVVAEGVYLSSRDIAARSPGDDGLRRARTIRAYQLRAQHRPTPQGVFAGVTEISFDSETAILGLGSTHRARTYPNPVWLHAACDVALDDSDVLHGLYFTANPLTVRRGDRLEAERPSHDSAPVRVSIRSTAATRLILRTCRHGASWHSIAKVIGAEWPTVPAATMEKTVRALVRDGFLITDLAPDDACDDPLSHVLKRLDGHRLRQRLSRLRDTLADADTHTPGAPERASALAEARGKCDAITLTSRPLMVDVNTNAHIQLPAALADDAARAANVLWRTSTSSNNLAAYHAAFLERYGTHRLVPLTEATDEVTGLGTTTHHQRSNPPDDGGLTRLYAQRLSTGAIEVEVDDDAIDALERRSPTDRPPASAEIYVRVLAANMVDRDAGRFFLAVSGTAQPAGATKGRFTTLLPTRSTTDTGSLGPMVAELAFQPRAHVAQSLLNPAPPVPFRIRLGGHAHNGDLLPDDLALTSDGHRLIVWSTVHERQVIPVHHNHIGHALMPPLAALLCQLGQHRTIPLTPWSWGNLEQAPFTPRVRYGSTILAPARWRLPTTLTTATTDTTRWAAALDQWRRTTAPAPPSIVVTDDEDRQLPLDLDRDDDSELLRRYVSRGMTTVTEPPGGLDAVAAVVPGPQGHHILEAVIPLTSTTPDPPTAVAPTSPRRFGQGLHLPGGEWLSLTIRTSQSTQDTVLTRVDELAAKHQELWDRWFWLRYHTDALGPHLRVRFHGDPGALAGQLLPAINDLCARLVHERLSGGATVETYDQEIERYGGAAAITAAETVFYRDTELALDILTTATATDDQLAAAALSAAEVARVVADRALPALEPYRLNRFDRTTFNRLRPTVRKLDDTGHVGSHDLWRARTEALQTWRDTLPANRTSDCASSMTHMHANRVLGDTHTERIARALAKDLLARKTP